MPATAMAAEPIPWTALATSRQVNEPDIENTGWWLCGDEYTDHDHEGDNEEEDGDDEDDQIYHTSKQVNEPDIENTG